MQDEGSEVRVMTSQSGDLGVITINSKQGLTNEVLVGILKELILKLEVTPCQEPRTTTESQT